jgi:hypothetical protein
MAVRFAASVDPGNIDVYLSFLAVTPAGDAWYGRPRMVKSEEDLETLLGHLERRFERLPNGTFLVAVGANSAPVAMRIATPVLVTQVAIGPAPSGNPKLEAQVFRKLLELNANDLLHAAYALEGDRIVLTAALELENLDLNELEAVLADVGLALSKHVPVLLDMIQAKAG